jgi:hypothetical protein
MYIQRYAAFNNLEHVGKKLKVIIYVEIILTSYSDKNN